MFDWKPEYCLGMAVVDQQHQELFRLADVFFAAVQSGKGKTVVSDTLAKLLAYTQEHFRAEETLLASHGFPQIAEHKAMHKVLTQKVLDYQKGFEADTLIITIQVLRFVRDWLETHILVEDRKYVEFLKSKKAA